MSHDLLHEALMRKMRMDAAMRGEDARSPPMSSTSGRSEHGNDSEDEDERISVRSSSGNHYDSVYTPVHTRPGTPTGTPRRGRLAAGGAATPGDSRSTSPTGTGSRMAKKRAQEEQERKSSRDPLRRFENDVSSRIFRELDEQALARCLRVSKRWQRSATISGSFCDGTECYAGPCAAHTLVPKTSPDWAWYLRFHHRRSNAPLNREPIWTRKESKENWAQRYRSAFTLNGLQFATAIEADIEKARSDGYRTPKELQEERWALEAGSTHGNVPGAGGVGSGSSTLNNVFGGDRNAARDYYKGLGGRTKIKGSDRGGATGPRDRTAYGEEDYY